MKIIVKLDDNITKEKVAEIGYSIQDMLKKEIETNVVSVDIESDNGARWLNEYNSFAFTPDVFKEVKIKDREDDPQNSVEDRYYTFDYFQASNTVMAFAKNLKIRGVTTIETLYDIYKSQVGIIDSYSRQVYDKKISPLTYMEFNNELVYCIFGSGYLGPDIMIFVNNGMTNFVNIVDINRSIY